jgi:hypothetical protein
MLKFNVTVIDDSEYRKAEADPDYAPKERVVQTITGETEADIRYSFRRLQKTYNPLDRLALVRVEG